MPSEVYVRVYEELNDYLPAGKRKRSFVQTLKPGWTVGRIAVYLGLPEQEIDLVLVNGKPVDFGHILHDQDRISFYPVFESFDIGSVTGLPGRPLRRPQFVVDKELPALARLLISSGFDAIPAADSDEKYLACGQGRILLKKHGTQKENIAWDKIYFIQKKDPEEQLKEVLDRFQLTIQSGE